MMSSQGVREYKNPLTPTLLYRLLNVAVCDKLCSQFSRDFEVDGNGDSDLTIRMSPMWTEGLCKTSFSSDCLGKCFLTLCCSYISNLNPYYILALTETASFHQVEILRDAIFKHIALQTSIRARINVSIQQLKRHG